jgi:hypothetical protein
VLEGVNPRDRGYVVSRVLSLYAPKEKYVEKTGPRAPKGPSKPLKEKSPLNSLWSKTEEYLAWDEAKTAIQKVAKAQRTSEQISNLNRLQAEAFRRKVEIKAQLPQGDVSMGGAEHPPSASAGPLVPAEAAPSEPAPSDSKRKRKKVKKDKERARRPTGDSDEELVDPDA